MNALTESQRAAVRAARAKMMARARGKGAGKVLSYALQAALLFPVIGILRFLPVDAASALGGWIGRRLVPLLDREAHWETMRVAFPTASTAELDALIVGMADNVGRVLGETVHLADFAGADNPRIRLIGADRTRGRLSGQGLLLIGGHFGNWEIVSCALRGAGLDGLLVVQHPNNPFVLGWIAQLRLRHTFSETVGTGDGVYAAFRRRLKGGGIAAMLADQRVLNGIEAPFFGVKTTTNLIPARLARDLGVPVAFVSGRRLAGARFEVEIHEPFHVERTADRAADELAFTTRMNNFFADQIRAAPAHWLWGHPRFDDALYELDAEGRRLRRKP